MFYPPPKPAKAEAPGTGKGILGGLLGLGLLALGVALIAATFYDIWQVSSLRDRGVQVQANVAIEGFGTEHQRVGLSDYSIPVINYSYSFEVQGNTYRGSASDSDPDFTGARQQEKAKGRSDQPSPPRVGSVLVTYLPETPPDTASGGWTKPTSQRRTASCGWASREGPFSSSSAAWWCSAVTSRSATRRPGGKQRRRRKRGGQPPKDVDWPIQKRDAGVVHEALSRRVESLLARLNVGVLALPYVEPDPPR